MVAPISACLIVKNEAGQIESCLKSIRPYVSEICVVDTGSTDGTPEIVKRFADRFEIYTGCNDENGLIASFADARQRSFELATQPWLFWIDGDDEVCGAEHLEELVKRHDEERNGNPALVLMPYEYSHDERGNVTCLHYRERLLTPRDAFKWVGPVHEVMSPQVGNVQMFQTEQVKMVHRRTQSGKAIEDGRNLRILKAHYEKVGESDVRQLYYLGLEYGNVGDQAMAVKFHKRYVELSGWDDEKFHACLKIAEHYQSIGHYEDAVEWATKAVIVREGWAEAYFSLSKSFYFMAQRGGREERRNWERSVHFANLGLSLPPTKTILFVNPIEREYGIHKFLNFSLNKVGDVRGAMDSVNRALAIRPDDDGLLGNKRIYEEHLAKEQVRDGTRKLKELGVLMDDAVSLIDDVVEKRTKIIPDAVLESPDSGIRPVPDDGLDIVFYVGPGVEPWNPVTMRQNGIGGSETAAAEMSRLLAARGHRVRLYGDCENIEGVFERVQYLNHSRFQDVSCDVFISSRRPHVFDDNFGLKARATMCWVHDVSLGGALTHGRALRMDRILALSEWHKGNILKCHKFVHPGQVIVTRNGIDLARFDHDVPRHPHKAVYSSSPDRGLDVALRAWPRVRERISDAELHVFYGFKTWEVTAESTGDEGQKKLIQHLKNQLKEYEKHGVVFHGRVGQEELAKEFLSAGVWAYPTWFSETSCQLAGTLISTSDGMKLIEDVKVGDTVLTHKGRFRRVTELVRKKYEGPLYSVKRKKDFRPIQLTAEHPLWVHRGDEFRWLTPGEIRPKTDSLFTPKMEFGVRKSILLSDYVDMPVVDGVICRKHNHPVHKPTVNEVELTEDVMFILGLFAADGHAGWNARRNAPGAITFALHKFEKAYLIERVRYFFGGKVRQTSENGVVVTAYCSPWASFLRKVIGVGRSKRIPSFVWECPMDLQRAFHDGMFAGDGYVSTSPRGNGRVTEPFNFYTSVSPSLAYGMAQLLSNLGFHPGISYSEERDAYTLNWSERRVGWHEDVESGFTTEVESVQCEYYDGLVYNFDVEEDRSYITDRTAVHNCITAMEAQAAGLHIVTSPIAALNETVGPRGKMISGDWLTPDYMDRWVDAVVGKMGPRSKGADDQERGALQDYARNNFGWETLADEWDMMIRKTLEEVERDIVPPYKAVI